LIRPAGPDDLENVVRLIGGFRDWWEKTEPTDDTIRGAVARLLDDPNTDYLLAFDDSATAVGVCQLRYRLSVWTGVDDCWLEDLFVDESARRGDHGRQLVEAAFEAARRRGCRRIELDVNEQNEAALGFYQSLGFTLEPKPPGRTLFISRRL
jgi:ribosomal protein S18 acetylase RimI-like enzyme